ncbi:MAG: permease [Thermoleophilia bacterium]
MRGLRIGRGDRPLRSSASRRDLATARIPPHRPRPGDLRLVQEVRVTWIALPFAVATVLSTLAGGAVAFRLRRELQTVIALTGGVVVAVALFDVLPEAVDTVNDGERIGLLVGAGFLAFFLAHRLLVLHHRDPEAVAQTHQHVGALGAAGLSLHSFIDGLGIGLAFNLSTSAGVLVFIAVVSHDFADGLNTVGFVLRQGGAPRRALLWLSIDAVAPLLGAVVGAVLKVDERSLGQLLALYVGFFLYMGATDLLPEAHEHPSWQRIGLTLLGFAAILMVALLAPH